MIPGGNACKLYLGIHSCTGVHVNGQVVPADVVVLAMGPWTDVGERDMPVVIGSPGSNALL